MSDSCWIAISLPLSIYRAQMIHRTFSGSASFPFIRFVSLSFLVCTCVCVYILETNRKRVRRKCDDLRTNLYEEVSIIGINRRRKSNRCALNDVDYKYQWRSKWNKKNIWCHRDWLLKWKRLFIGNKNETKLLLVRKNRYTWSNCNGRKFLCYQIENWIDMHLFEWSKFWYHR